MRRETDAKQEKNINIISYLKNFLKEDIAFTSDINVESLSSMQVRLMKK
jgi:hypothetical protein